MLRSAESNRIQEYHSPSHIAPEQERDIFLHLFSRISPKHTEYLTRTTSGDQYFLRKEVQYCHVEAEFVELLGSLGFIIEKVNKNLNAAYLDLS